MMRDPEPEPGPRPGVSADQADAAEVARLLARVEWLTSLLDSQYKVPGTRFRLGWDPLIGLMPVVGDLVSACVSIYLLVLSRRLGAGSWLIAKMSINVAADTLMGMIPFVGPLIDAVYKANTQNLKLLLDDMQVRRRR